MALGRTTYADGSCSLIGEADLYGLGVRISYYLFFFASLMAIFRDTISSKRKVGPLGKCAEAINILTFAILIVLIRNTMNGSFAILEWFLTYPTILITFIGLFWSALPILDNWGTYFCYSFTFGLLNVSQAWLYWRHMYQGRKSECKVYYWFFGIRNFYGETWTTFFKAMSILALVIGGILLLFAGILLAWKLCRGAVECFLQCLRTWYGRHGGDKGGGIDEKEAKRRCTKWRFFGLAVLLFAGITTIVMTETTIRINLIDLSDTPLDSTSQLIPFLTGLLSFLSVSYSCVHPERRPAEYK